MYMQNLVCNYAQAGNDGDMNFKLSNINNTSNSVLNRNRNVHDGKGLLQLPAWVQVQQITLCPQIIIGF